MIPNTLKSFIRRLLEATDAGDIQWMEGAPMAYFCNHKTYELHINFYFDDEAEVGSYHFSMKELNKGAAYFSVSTAEDDFDIMKNLFDTITVSAAGFDDIESKFFD